MDFSISIVEKKSPYIAWACFRNVNPKEMVFLITMQIWKLECVNQGIDAKSLNVNSVSTFHLI